jgi:tRNA threonylcarbamoyladenosine biosynthesis protein TsaE
MSAIPTVENPSALPSATIFSTMLVVAFAFDALFSDAVLIEMMAAIDSIVETSTFLADESATLAFAAQFAATLTAPMSIALHGDLGAGKTTFVRGLLRALRVIGSIKSPTYALVETYDTTLGEVHHMDAYRIEGRDDFEARGGIEYFITPSIRLVEWPERIEGIVSFDVDVWIDFDGVGRRVSVKRILK